MSNSMAIPQPKQGSMSIPIAAKEQLFLVAGEMSGDLLGGLLARHLRRQLPQYPLFGVAGPQMCKEGVHSIGIFDQLQVMGIGDVVKRLPQILQQKKRIEKEILTRQPKAVIFIDYPGLNIRIAESLRKKGYKGKLIHYVCPSVWVWGKGRIPRMAKTLDLLLTLFPFEPPHFENTKLKTLCVGHPIDEQIRNYIYAEDWKRRSGIDGNKPLLAVFPGSRKGEIEKTFPLQVEAVKLWLKRYPDTAVGVSYVNQELKKIMERLLGEMKSHVVFVPSHYSYEMMRDARCALATSGTVTLELAMHTTPTVVLYGVSKAGRLLAKYLFNLDLPHYCIVNIIQEETVFPELIKQGYDPLNICHELEKLWEEGEERQKCLQGCKAMQENLRPKDGLTPSEKAAREICTSLQLN